MIPRFTPPLIALVFALPAPLAAQDVQDFQLPPAPSPTPSPNVQGPVDVESAPVPVRPRAIPSDEPVTEETAAPTPVPTIIPAPVFETEPEPAPTTVDRPSPAPMGSPAAAPPPIQNAGAGPVTQPDVTAGEQAAPDRQVPTVSAPIEPAAPATPAENEERADETGGLWLWIAGGLGLLAALGAAFFIWRRRGASAAPPQIQRPTVVRPAENATVTGAAKANRGMRVTAEAIKLTRSFANATLEYRVTLINQNSTAMSGVAIAADMVSAHGDLPMEQQVATPDQALGQRHVFDRIAPGQSVRYEGKLTLPLAQAKVIRQGQLALLVPLLRLRIEGTDEGSMVRTFVVGQGAGDGGRVAPFRLDEGPRTWSPIAARALD